MIRIIDEEVSGDTIQVTFLARGEHNQTDGKGIVDGYVKLAKASTPGEVKAFGKTWWKTTFFADEAIEPTNTGYTSRYVRVTADGFLVEVSLTGKNHESNKKLKAVQDTLSFKR
jgi:hypothetical protein